VGPSSGMKIREAELVDAGAISGLLAELGYPAEASDTLRRLPQIVGRETDGVLVAVRGDEVIGLVSIHAMPLLHREGNAGRITALAVTQSARGEGVGTALVRAAEDWAWSRNCRRIEVTSGDHRHGAHKFYEQVGYRRGSGCFIKDRDSQG
jgi:GNAT superfamily N-acetyltransferase